MCSIDLDPCDVWRETPRRAAKGHRCDGCGSTIAKGEHYLVHFDLFEGSANNEKMCWACWIDREQFADEHGNSFRPSGLIEMLRDCIEERDDNSPRWRSVLAGVLRRVRSARSKREEETDAG